MRDKAYISVRRICYLVYITTASVLTGTLAVRLSPQVGLSWLQLTMHHTFVFLSVSPFTILFVQHFALHFL